MRPLLIAATCALALVPALAPAPARAAGVKTFKAWYAVCNNLRACVAFGFPGEDTDTSGYLRIARGGAPGAGPVVSLASTDEDAPKSGAWTVQVDGHTVPGLAAVAVNGADDGQAVKLSPAQGVALVDAIRNGRQLTVLAGGKTVFSLPLSGSAAALLWVDDQQQRVGSMTALGRKGDKPAASMPPTAAPPVLHAAPAVSQAGLPKRVPASVWKARGKDCTAEAGGPADVALIARLARGLVLWGPVCDQGAYSIGNSLLLGDERGGALRPLKLPYPAGLEEHQVSELADPDFEPKTGTLSTFAKGRGIGDCGEVLSWVWDGKAFQLLNADVMTECHGVPMDDWPNLWTARQH